MAVDAAVLIRAGSGALFAALGLAILVVTRVRVWDLGLLCAGFGVRFLALNLALAFPSALAFDVMLTTTDAAMLAGSIALTRRLAAGTPAIAIGYAVGAARVAITLASVARDPAGAGWSDARAIALNIVFVAMQGSVAALVVAASWRAIRALPEERRRLAGVALGFGLFLACEQGEVIGFVAIAQYTGTDLALFVALAVVLLPPLVVPWLLAAQRGAGRLAIVLALLPLGMALAGMLQALDPRAATEIDAFGLIGIARTLGWGFLVWAILRADLLGVPLPTIAARRGTVAAAVLASFFVVAQIAQNFLSDRMGVVAGGLVAGAMLFAASPIQRAAERALGTPSADERATRIYRYALRAALADGAMTPAEEEHLAELAQELGLTHATALRLRRDEEQKS